VEFEHKGITTDRIKDMEDLNIGYSVTGKEIWGGPYSYPIPEFPGEHSYEQPCDKALDLIANARDKESIINLYNPPSAEGMTDHQKRYLKEFFCKTGNTELVDYLIDHKSEWEGIHTNAYADVVSYTYYWANEPEALIEQYQQKETLIKPEEQITDTNNGLSEFDSVAPEQYKGDAAGDYELGSLEEMADDALAELKAETEEAKKNSPVVDEQQLVNSGR
jgi:hypothetical protein